MELTRSSLKPLRPKRRTSGGGVKKCMTCCIDKGQCVQSPYTCREDLHMRTLLLAHLDQVARAKIGGPADPRKDIV